MHSAYFKKCLYFYVERKEFIMKMKDLPEAEKPYEKLENCGASCLSNSELLAVLIKSGTKDKTAVQLSQEVLLLDESNAGLSFLNSISLHDLQQIKGLGRVKAIQIKAFAELASRFAKPAKLNRRVIKSPEDLASVVMGELKDEPQEVIKTAILNSQNQLLRIITNSIGTVNSNTVEIKDVLREPIKSGASKIILVHNHPGGNPNPSDCDIRFSIKIRDAAAIFGIEVLDHLVIGNGFFKSMKRLNLF